MSGSDEDPCLEQRNALLQSTEVEVPAALLLMAGRTQALMECEMENSMISEGGDDSDYRMTILETIQCAGQIMEMQMKVIAVSMEMLSEEE